MDEFAPLLIVLLFWVFIGSGLKKVAKNATKGKKGPQKTGTASLKGVKDAFFPAEAFPEKASPEKAAAAAPAEKAAPAAAAQPASNPPVPASAPLRPAPMVSALRESAPAERPQPAPMVSTLRESAPADRPQPAPYLGSLAKETGEGDDPCHEEQMAELNRLRAPSAPSVAPDGDGLNLSWSGEDIVRGFITGEILRRRDPRAGFPSARSGGRL